MCDRLLVTFNFLTVKSTNLFVSHENVEISALLNLSPARSAYYLMRVWNSAHMSGLSFAAEGFIDVIVLLFCFFKGKKKNEQSFCSVRVDRRTMLSARGHRHQTSLLQSVFARRTEID